MDVVRIVAIVLAQYRMAKLITLEQEELLLAAVRSAMDEAPGRRQRQEAGAVRWYDDLRPGGLSGDLTVRWLSADLFEFTPSADRPFAFVRSTGDVIQPGWMVTDGGSIPRPLWVFRNYSPWGYAPAYIIHDWLFTAHRQRLPEYAHYSLDEAALVLAEVVRTMLAPPAVGPAPGEEAVLRSIFEAVRSPIARRYWDSGPATRTGRQDAAAVVEYTLRFP